jgi:integrase
MYESSFKSPFTARAYTTHLKKYANGDLVSLLNQTQREAEDRLIDFIITNKEKGMAWGALHNYVAAVAKFYLINDFSFNIARVKRFMPEETRIKKDRAYSTDEIFALLQLANERTRAIILLLCSTGMRLGGLAGLQLADFEDKDVIYKITVYRNTKSEYFTYCTPEARRAIDIYLEVRKRHGEQFDPKRGGGANPVIREQYNYEDQFCMEKRLPKESNQTFSRRLKQSGFEYKQDRQDKGRPYVWESVKLVNWKPVEDEDQETLR